MTGPWLLVAAVLSSSVVAALVALIGTRATLKATRPRTEAEADELQARAASQSIESQGKTIDRLNGEITRLQTDLDKERTDRKSENENNSAKIRALLVNQRLLQEYAAEQYKAHPDGNPPPVLIEITD